jgi:hypothetical protein
MNKAFGAFVKRIATAIDMNGRGKAEAITLHDEPHAACESAVLAKLVKIFVEIGLAFCPFR